MAAGTGQERGLGRGMIVNGEAEGEGPRCYELQVIEQGVTS